MKEYEAVFCLLHSQIKSSSLRIIMFFFFSADTADFFAQKNKMFSPADTTDE